MSYFEDQYEAWMDNNCQGEITDMNPDEFWADRMSDCEEKGHGEIKMELVEGEDGKKRKMKVCQKCKAILL